MKVTALKKLSTARWRTLGQGEGLEVRRYRSIGLGGDPSSAADDTYNVTLNTHVEIFTIQLSDAEARKLLAELSARVPRLPPKRINRGALVPQKENTG